MTEPLHLRLWFVSLVTLILAALLLFVGWILFTLTGKASEDLYQKLSELSLQLAVIVVIGGALKAIADSREREKKAIEEQRERDREATAKQSTQRQEFARRAREMHVPIEFAGELLRAHQTPETYSEQLQSLMRLRYQIENLHADLVMAAGLFKNADSILAGIDGILEFLEAGTKEYQWAHKFMETDWPQSSFEEIVKNRELTWVRSLMTGEGAYEKYMVHLSKSKGEMRSQVYGSS